MVAESRQEQIMCGIWAINVTQGVECYKGEIHYSELKIKVLISDLTINPVLECEVVTELFDFLFTQGDLETVKNRKSLELEYFPLG